MPKYIGLSSPILLIWTSTVRWKSHQSISCLRWIEVSFSRWMTKYTSSSNIEMMRPIRQLWAAINHQSIIIDGLIALFLSMLALSLLWYNWNFFQPVRPALAIVLTLLVILPLTFRRRFPLSILLLTTTTLHVHRLLDIPEGTATAYALLLALFSAGAYGSKRWRTWIRGICVASIAINLIYQLFFRLPTETSLFAYEENQVLAQIATVSVSYTHLRAHET